MMEDSNSISEKLRSLCDLFPSSDHNSLLTQAADELQVKTARVMELEALINNPELDDFLNGLKLESAHQTERWGRNDEEKKFPHEYANVVSYLVGKLIKAIWDRDKDKFKHHCISIAAALFNCHRQVRKTGTQVHRWFSKEENS